MRLGCSSDSESTNDLLNFSNDDNLGEDDDSESIINLPNDILENVGCVEYYRDRAILAPTYTRSGRCNRSTCMIIVPW
jgi:hypothetical protein